MTDEQSDVLYEVDEPVAIIRLNRPEKLNAFTHSTLAQLRQAVDQANRDSRVVGMVITGEGRGFCAGLDAEVLEQTARGTRQEPPRAGCHPRSVQLFSRRRQTHYRCHQRTRRRWGLCIGLPL